MFWGFPSRQKFEKHVVQYLVISCVVCFRVQVTLLKLVLFVNQLRSDFLQENKQDSIKRKFDCFFPFLTFKFIYRHCGTGTFFQSTDGTGTKKVPRYRPPMCSAINACAIVVCNSRISSNGARLKMLPNRARCWGHSLVLSQPTMLLSTGRSFASAISVVTTDI